MDEYLSSSPPFPNSAINLPIEPFPNVVEHLESGGRITMHDMHFLRKQSRGGDAPICDVPWGSVLMKSGHQKIDTTGDVWMYLIQPHCCGGRGGCGGCGDCDEMGIVGGNKGSSATYVNDPGSTTPHSVRPSKMKWCIRQKDGLLWTYTTHLYGDQKSCDKYGADYRIKYDEVRNDEKELEVESE